jgi:hypothetical protein
LNGKNHTLWGRVNFAYAFVSVLTVFLKVLKPDIGTLAADDSFVRIADLYENRSESQVSAL